MHVLAMREYWRETYFGVGNASLLRSAIARPRQAAHYEQADGIRQAAYLFHGLLMNHGFVQGNKRTAWLAMRWFLRRNGIVEIIASQQASIDMCYSAENDKWPVERIEDWLRVNSKATN